MIILADCNRCNNIITAYGEDELLKKAKTLLGLEETPSSLSDEQFLTLEAKLKEEWEKAFSAGLAPKQSEENE